VPGGDRGGPAGLAGQGVTVGTQRSGEGMGRMVVRCGQWSSPASDHWQAMKGGARAKANGEALADVQAGGALDQGDADDLTTCGRDGCRWCDPPPGRGGVVWQDGLPVPQGGCDLGPDCPACCTDPGGPCEGDLQAWRQRRREGVTC
jgi:hypothetical protein